jgi:hypothetical protein
LFSQPNSFLAIILHLPIPKTRLNSIPLLPSSCLGRLVLGTRLTLLNWTPLCNHFTRTTQKTQPLCCWEGVFTAPLHSNGSYSIVVCVFFAAGMCLLSSCLAVDVSSDFTIPAFGRHVTIINTFPSCFGGLCLNFGPETGIVNVNAGLLLQLGTLPFASFPIHHL